MNILFISYWGIYEGLSQSTVIPHVKILSDSVHVFKLYLVTMERGQKTEEVFMGSKIHHIPIYSKTFHFPLFEKFIDYIRIPGYLIKLTRLKNINCIIARGTPAGTLAYLIWAKTRIRFFVESFEPHSLYMIQTGTWNKFGIRYLLQKKSEKKQIKHAEGLIPVSENYRKILISGGFSPEKVYTVPCGVDHKEFDFNIADRIKIREKLNIQKKVVAVYTGKFNGLYLKEESFSLMKKLFDFFSDFFLIILTPEDPEYIKKMLIKFHVPSEYSFVDGVYHKDIPQFLSASDFGLALYKEFPSNSFLSPIKVGEYWANGLPVLLTKGVGDESYFLEHKNAGALLDLNNPLVSFKRLEAILKQKDHRSQIKKMAYEYRSYDYVKEGYQKLIFNNPLVNSISV